MFGRATRRRRLSQTMIIQRDSMIAVNIEVTSPNDSVTAKPRTGPVPNW